MALWWQLPGDQDGTRVHFEMGTGDWGLSRELPQGTTVAWKTPSAWLAAQSWLGGIRKAVSYPEWQKVLPVSHGLPGPDPTPLKLPDDSSKGQGLVAGCRQVGSILFQIAPFSLVCSDAALGG